MRATEVKNDLLNRWVKQKEEKLEVKTWDMPKDPGTVTSLTEAEKWRKKITEILTQKLRKLYMDPLPDQQTKYLNDKVNVLIRRLRSWELRIVELGGVDYGRVGIMASNGDVLNTNQNQYQYFGRARNLPGVKELIESEKQKQNDVVNISNKQKLREHLLEIVDADYYGLETDDSLEDLEKKYEIVNGVPDFEPL